MSSTNVPSCAIVRDVNDRHIMFVDVSVGIICASQYARRFQKLVLGGGPVTVHINRQLGRFQFSPSFMNAYVDHTHLHHIIDLPQCNILEGNRHVSPTASYPDDEDDKANELATNQPMGTQTPASTAHIKRPRNQWIIYRSQKSKEIHQSNPGMSASEISTEVSRQWKMESQEVKAYYQAVADEEARQHKLKYPDYRYKPGRQ